MSSKRLNSAKSCCNPSIAWSTIQSVAKWKCAPKETVLMSIASVRLDFLTVLTGEWVAFRIFTNHLESVQRYVEANPLELLHHRNGIPSL